MRPLRLHAVGHPVPLRGAASHPRSVAPSPSKQLLHTLHHQHSCRQPGAAAQDGAPCSVASDGTPVEALPLLGAPAVNEAPTAAAAAASSLTRRALLGSSAAAGTALAVPVAQAVKTVRGWCPSAAMQGGGTPASACCTRLRQCLHCSLMHSMSSHQHHTACPLVDSTHGSTGAGRKAAGAGCSHGRVSHGHAAHTPYPRSLPPSLKRPHTATPLKM